MGECWENGHLLWPAARPLTTNTYIVISTHMWIQRANLTVCALLLPRTLARMLACTALALTHFILVSERLVWHFVCTSASCAWTHFMARELHLLAVSDLHYIVCRSVSYGACGLFYCCSFALWAVLWAPFAYYTHTGRGKWNGAFHFWANLVHLLCILQLESEGESDFVAHMLICHPFAKTFCKKLSFFHSVHAQAY